MTFLRLCSRAPWMTSRSVPTDPSVVGARDTLGNAIPPILRRMERDLRDTPLYKDVEDFYRRALGPGFGRTSDVSDPRPSPDGTCIAFRGDQWERLEGHPVGRIGLAAIDGSWVRQITNGPRDDDQPAGLPTAGR